MPSPSLYHRHRFPAEIISSLRLVMFSLLLSLRDVEEMLADARRLPQLRDSPRMVP